VDEVAALPATVAAVVDELTSSGVLRRRPDGWYWPRNDRPSDVADIRGGLGPVVQLVELDTGRLLGTVDRSRAPVVVHPGAVYVHQGSAFVVTDLDLDASAAMLVRGDPGYDTVARRTTEVRLVDETRHLQTANARLSFGTAEVASAVVGFQKRSEGGTVIEEVPLYLPEQRLRTTAVWWSMPDEVAIAAGVTARRIHGAAHAAEHAAIGLLPLFASCDPWDVGGTSTARHPDTGQLTVAIHDAYPGGAGLAARAFESAPGWLSATRDAVAACACATGCPSCVQSARCGSGNTPLDKAGALGLLTAVATGLA
jgi:DEAD/DEAH box helicase domain-containing protein